MAVTAREILLIFRGQNYMSQAIRKVGTDIGGLSRGAQLTNQRSSLSLAAQQVRHTRQNALNSRNSMVSGSARLTQEKAIAAQKLAQMRSDSTLLKNQANLSALTRRVKAGQPLPGKTLAETNMMLQAQKIDVEAATRAIADQDLAVQKLAADEERLQAGIARTNNTMNASSQALLTRYKPVLEQNAKAIKQLPFDNFASGAAKVEHAGRAIQMFGLITGAAMGYAADQAAKFNTQAVLAATQSTVPGQNTVAQVQRNAAVIQQQIQKLLIAGRTTATPSDLTTSAYNIYSGVTLKGNQRQQVQAGLDLLKQFNKVLTANYGMVSLDQVTQAGITIMNDFGLSVKKIPSALNTMQAAVRYGRITMSEFLGTLNQAAPAAKSAHYSFDQMASTIAFLSRKFPSVSIASTGYARLLQTLAQNAQKFNQAGYQVTNKSGSQLLPLEDIVRNILQKNPSLAQGGVQLQNFFKQTTGQTGYIQARRVFTFLAQDLNGYDKMTKNVMGDQNELNKSIAAAQKSPGVKWQEFINQLRGVILVLGAGAIPAFKAFAAPIEAAIRWFDNLNPRTQKFIGYVTAMVGILALLGGILAAVGGGLARLGAIAAATFLGRGGAGLAGEAGLINLRFVAMFEAVGLLILAFTKFHSQTMAVVNAFGGLGNTIAVVVSAFAAWKLIGYVIMFAKLAANTAALTTSITEVGTAAKIATAETIGLRGAMMGIAGLVVTATILLVEKKKVAAAGENLLSDTLGKEINPLTGQSNQHLSTTQQIGAFLFGKTPSIGTLATRLRNSIIDNSGLGHDTGDTVWGAMIKERMSGIQRVSLVYQNWLRIIGKPGSPKALNEFLKMFKQAQLGQTSSAASFTDWLNTVNQAASGTQGVTNLGKQIQLIKKYMFELGRTDPFKDMNNRLTQARTKLTNIVEVAKKAAAASKTLDAAMLQAAVDAGITATPQFEKLYDAVNKAQKAFTADPSFKTQAALVTANNALSAYEDKVKKTNKAVAQSTQETFQNVLSSIQSMYNQFQTSEQSIMGTLFSGPFMNSPAMQNFLQWGGKTTGVDLSKDLNSQINQFRKFHNELDKLQKRGAPAELINQLMQLGPSALPQIEALQNLSGKQLDHYFSMFRTSQKLIQQQTMKDLNQQLKQYRKFGQNVALAIVAGLQDQNVAVTNALKKMIRDVFPGLPGAGQHQQHHRQQQNHQRQQHHHQQQQTGQRQQHNHPTQQQQTAATMQHLQHVIIDSPKLPWRIYDTKELQKIHGNVHVTNQLKYLKVSIDSPKMPWHVITKREAPSEQHDHYHLDVPKGSQIDTQVRHAHFRTKNKHPRKKLTGSRYD